MRLYEYPLVAVLAVTICGSLSGCDDDSSADPPAVRNCPWCPQVSDDVVVPVGDAPATSQPVQGDIDSAGSGNVRASEWLPVDQREPYDLMYTMTDHDGEPFTLKSLMGKPVAAARDGHETAAYEATNAHVHTRTTAIVGLIHLGIVTGNKDYIEFGKRAYDWMRSQSSTFGWVPENMQTAGREVSEMCCVTDMIGIQTLLAKAGYSECWDHVEQYVRNHVIESQISAAGSLSDILRDNLQSDPPDDTDEISYDNALGRMAGGFAGPIYPNDLFSAYPQSRTAPREQWLIDVSGCCAPSGAKALYLAWDNIVTTDSTGIWVNLAIDRDSEWVKVVSARPLEGRIEIKARTDLPIHFRMPGWVDKHDVECRVDGTETGHDWIGEYLCCRHLIAGQELSVRYPLREFTATEHLAGLPYAVSWRGDTVVKVESDESPVLPLYRR